MLLMVVIKPCDTSMPKLQLPCDDMMVGLDVSHGSMPTMNPFFTTFDVPYAPSSRSKEWQHI
jgi:hypothetical protein